MRILPHPLSNRYSSRSLTCVFTDIPFYERTFTTEVHAFSPSPHFPHVQLLQQYMRFLLLRIFRTYHYRNSTCDSFFSVFSARTVTAALHAISQTSPFTHVHLPQRYMLFLRLRIFRTYSYRNGTYAFALTSNHFKYFLTIASIFLMFNGRVLVSMLYSRLSPYQ